MHEVTRLIGYLLAPLTLVLLLAVSAAFLWMFRRRVAAAMTAASAFLLLWIASLPVTAEVLAFSLESKYPVVAPTASPQADAIVLLGGALFRPRPPARPVFTLGSDSIRISHAAALYRAGRAPRVLVAAGGEVDANGVVEAQAIAEVLKSWGVPASAIILEPKSRTTRENASYALQIAKAQRLSGVLLVTSSSHMPRAMATFSKVWAPTGIRVIASPAGTGLVQPAKGPELWIPDVSALVLVTRNVKEYAGLLAISMM